MVNNSVIVFEKGKIILNPNDSELLEQFSNYKIKSVSSSGLPIYTSEDEHIVDVVLCQYFGYKKSNFFMLYF